MRIKSKIKKHSRHSLGFTLVELLVVISIIGMISSIAYSALATARVKARTARRLADLTQLQKALALYYSDNNAYPVSTGGTGGWDGLYTCWGDASTNWIAGLASYMTHLPRDPRNHTACDEQYIYYSNGIDYKLISHAPEECTVVRSRYPNMIDPARDCWAYGYWTTGASTW